MNFTDDKGTFHLAGVINSGGFASGNVTDIPGATFFSHGKFKCNVSAAAAAVPAQGPTVTFNPIIGGLRVTVSDRSGVASQCTYTADNGFNRSFGLGANATAKLDIVPAVPELRDWAVTVECDNGTRSDVTTFF